MTQQDKELLLKDLSARLFYGVKVLDIITDTVKDVIGLDITSNYIAVKSSEVLYTVFFDDVKPYLRPMSSMTDEEESEYNLIQGLSHLDQHWTANDGKVYRYADAIDWLNAHHFDYRGLIEKDLAIEALEGMYK